MESLKIQLSVSDFIALTNQVLDGAYPGLEVVGEVSGFNVNQNKFVFFDLKDDTGTVSCFMMVWQLRSPIENGMQVRVSGTPKLTAKGRFSITVRNVQPVGEGSIKKSFDLLKAKLESEGLFDGARKRLLPPEPQRVAVISSTQAAGYADFVEVINQRWGGVELVVAHTAVQGDDAADQIRRAVEYFNQDADPAEVLVVVRGGGSADDLAAFNDEKLVRAIAASRIPTLVGVGHETDVSLVDLAADVRAATPTHAAELLVPDRRSVIEANRYRLSRVADHLTRDINALIDSDRNRLVRIVDQVEDGLWSFERDVKHIVSALRAYSPQSILDRGYAIVRGEYKVGAKIEIQTATANLSAEVQNVSKR